MSNRIITLIKKLLRRSRKKSEPVAAANIIPRTQHNVSKTDISANALKVLNRINSAGFQAYLVGGSVRDLLLGKAPKDFDIATSATPTQVKNLFRNGRIIGRRFKLVHIIFHRDIVEVATFRGNDNTESQHVNEQGMVTRDNVYGTFEEDAWRRDFTINSLYYNIDDASIIDITGGVDDIHARRIRIIGSADTRYQEDPVRMLRAIRFSAKLHFDIAKDTAEPINRLCHLIRNVSNSRLFEEVTKLYQCGEAESVQRLMATHGLFEQLFPLTHALLPSHYPVNALLGIALENTDSRIRDNKPITPAFLFAVILWFPMIERSKLLQKEENMPPLPALDKAMSQVIYEQNQITSVPKRITQIIREIWLLQFRFGRRFGGRAGHLAQHPRFRAAFDFLALRALAGDESMELAEWWTTYQEVSEEEQTNMVASLIDETPKKPRRRRKPKPKTV